MATKKDTLPKLGEVIDDCKVVGVISTTAIPRIYLRPLSTYPKYKFKVIINSGGSRLIPSGKLFVKKKNWKYFWATIVSPNGQIVFTGETRTSKSGLIKTIKNLFPNVQIVDKTK